MKPARLLWVVIVNACVLLLPPRLAAASTTADLPAALGQRLELAGPSIDIAGYPVDNAAIRQFYEARGHQPLWIEGGAFNGRARVLVEFLRQADHEGLNPKDYQPLIASAATTDDLAALELALSAALVRFANDVTRGRVEPSKVGAEQVAYAPPVDAVALLTGASDAPDLRAYLESLPPTNPIYQGLRAALARYKEIAAGGGWPLIPAGGKLARGANSPSVPLLRQHLQLTGDLPVGDAGSTLYDEGVERAVKRFQARHGLRADGRVDAQTLAELNVPVQERIRQVAVNLERARWMPKSFGDAYVLVNTAAFKLDVVRDGKTVLDMRVVVGKPNSSTPVFSDQIEAVEVNPYWRVPKSIAVEEMLPKLRANPAGALAAQNMKVFAGGKEVSPAVLVGWSGSVRSFPYLIRQEPGAHNALGRIKFSMPNEFDIYLHDTPSKSLFNRNVRAFSHGCIRVEQPVTLAEVLLQPTGNWPRERINHAIAQGKNRMVPLAQPIPVHLAYLTVWADPDGSVQFRNDLYDRDPRLAKALFAAAR